MARKKAWGFEGAYDARVESFFRENKISLRHPFKPLPTGILSEMMWCRRLLQSRDFVR